LGAGEDADETGIIVAGKDADAQCVEYRAVKR
jgi:hypothetical protein